MWSPLMHMRSRAVLRSGLLFSIASAASAMSCQTLVDTELGAGVGANCRFKDECQGSDCVDGICVIPCKANGCPDGTVCSENYCQLPMKASFLYKSDLAQEEREQSFDAARLAADSAFAYLSTSYVDKNEANSAAMDAARAALNDGATVIVGTSPTWGTLFSPLADSTDAASFLIWRSPVVTPNLVAFDARIYQAYYLAGIAAGMRTTTRRLGFVASSNSPPVVASVNAFLLGARRVDPMNVVQIVWFGMPSDERMSTQKLLTDGCDVIAHDMANNIPVLAVDQLSTTALSIGANVADGCKGSPSRCIASVHYNWSPFLTQLIDDAHRFRLPEYGVFRAEIETGSSSVVGFKVSGSLPMSPAIVAETETVRGELSSDDGVGRIFDGEIQSAQCEMLTGRMPCVAMGERLSDEDLGRMCWFVDGVVENSAAMEMPGVVPQTGECAPPPTM
jgi:basic membrane protein A and related proteins